MSEKRPGYITAADRREFAQVSLAGWTFQRRLKRHTNFSSGVHHWSGAMQWYCYGPVPTYFNGPYRTRREAVAYVIYLLTRNEHKELA